MRRARALWLVLLCGAGVAAAQPSDALSFERALALAAERAPMLAARQAALDAALQSRISADQLPDPKLTLGIDNLPVTGSDQFSVARDFMTQRSVGWMQEVPNAAKRAARAQVADARTERERALLLAEALAVRRDVAQAWIARHFAERRLALLGTLDDENRLLLGTLSARIASGKSMPADATMARQEALQLADRRDEFARERAKAIASLRRWLGDEALQPLAGEPPALSAVAAELHGQLDRHAELQVFGPMADMARAEALEIEAAKKGDWAWQVGYSRRGPAYSDMVSFQVTLELPLWGEKRQDPQIAAKRKEAQRIASEREELLRRHREDIDMQLAELDEIGRKLDRLKTSATPLAQERVTLALAAYESARGDLGAVLAARRERAELGLRAIDLQAQQHALRAKLNYFVAEQH
jgi:hypothetical protein